MEKKAENFGQLAEMAVQKQGYRYRLSAWAVQVWDDPDAGSAWADEDYRMWKKVHDAGRCIWDYPERKALEARRPKEHRVTQYLLTRKSQYSFRSEHIELTEKLGKQIEAVWPKDRHSRPRGTLTLEGILKRLGQTDAGIEIKRQRKAIEDRNSMISRNRARHNVVESIVNLRTTIGRAMDEGVAAKSFQVADGATLSRIIESLATLEAEMNTSLETIEGIDKSAFMVKA